MKISASLIPLFAALALGGCAGSAEADDPTTAASPSPDPTFIVNGSIKVGGGFRNAEPGDACTGRNGYDDMHGGAQVVIRDSQDEIVATGALDNGVAVEDSMGFYMDCELAFEVADVPDGSKFYTLAIGNRDPLTYSKYDISAAPLKLTLT